MGTSIADYREIAEWVGSIPQMTFNFHPNARPNSLDILV